MAKMKLIFYGELKSGEFKMNDRDKFLKYIAKMADPKDNSKPVRIRMTVEKVRKTRTTPQNSYYWGIIVAMVADEIGYNPWERQEVHNALKQAVRGMVGDQRLPVPVSTSTMTTTEFSEYVEDCRRWASLNLNINIPSPNEIEPADYDTQFMH